MEQPKIYLLEINLYRESYYYTLMISKVISSKHSNLAYRTVCIGSSIRNSFQHIPEAASQILVKIFEVGNNTFGIKMSQRDARRIITLLLQSIINLLWNNQTCEVDIVSLLLAQI